VLGNRELISQALANLLDNAIKYAAPRHAAPALAPAPGDIIPEAAPPADDQPEIVVGARSDGQRVVISVADAGPGIPAADRPRVVERFVRLEQSRSLPGSGLGLSLVSAVAHLHRGALRLEDNAPGLKAVLELPMAR
jgi:signal transduction histidine kinase